MATHVYAKCGADGIKAVHLCSDRSGWMLAPGLCSLMETNIDNHCSFCHQLIYLSFDPGMKMGHPEETHPDRKRWRRVHLGLAVD